MAPAVRALRGATTVDDDTPEHIDRAGRRAARRAARAQRRRPRRPHQHPVHRHRRHRHSMFPATAARKAGCGDVPADLRPRARHRRRHAHVHPGDGPPHHRAGPRRAPPRLPRGRPRPPRRPARLTCSDPLPGRAAGVAPPDGVEIRVPGRPQHHQPGAGRAPPWPTAPRRCAVPALSDDTEAMIDCLRALGAGDRGRRGRDVTVEGVAGRPTGDVDVFTRLSGTTSRFVTAGGRPGRRPGPDRRRRADAGPPHGRPGRRPPRPRRHRRRARRARPPPADGHRPDRRRRGRGPGRRVEPVPLRPPAGGRGPPDADGFTIRVGGAAPGVGALHR